MKPIDYTALGFRSGLEVHYQLMTERKLFCRCPAGRYSTAHDVEVLRHMRPTLSELGEYDGTALMEFKTKKQVIYQVRNDSVCTYEMDDTPPFPSDPKAVDIALEAAMLFQCSVVGEIHITRKQYLDGSIPTGFQRTAIVGVEGKIAFPNGREVGVVQVSFEEDSCREVQDQGHRITFRTDRLGMPLVEIVTYPEMRNPKEVAEVGRRIGQLLQSTQKVRRGIGSVRQDVNVSINGGPRIEIKGVPRIQAFERLTHNEAIRQKGLLEIRDELKKRSLSPTDIVIEATPVPSHGDEHERLKMARSADGEVWAVRAPGFAGILAWPLQKEPNGNIVPFLREVAGRVRVIACLENPPYVLCREATDPRYKEILSDAHWEHVSKAAQASKDDALMVVCGPEKDLRTAVQEIEIRLREAAECIPQETRQALHDGTTDFERILPGPDRMYPDTDLPPIAVDEGRLKRIRNQMTDPPWEREERYCAWGVPADVIPLLATTAAGDLFERLVAEAGAEPLLAAVELSRWLPRNEQDTGEIGAERWIDLFKAYGTKRFGREAFPLLLNALASDQSLSVDDAISLSGIKSISDKNLENIIDEVIFRHADDPMHNPTEANRLKRLMGIVMGRVRGCRDGREVMNRLKTRWKNPESSSATSKSS